ncbi:hypothetical protein TIFTF001_010230 [Ficus carica]|uniref:Uncharacterized protein n=1 Tax=Ficus carica TaxID=3494 RepID=A0AA87ZWN9_FICCA|nr:hypothetical protein TIFTF001_010230 [Ficus carica]
MAATRRRTTTMILPLNVSSAPSANTPTSLWSSTVNDTKIREKNCVLSVDGVSPTTTSSTITCASAG